MEKDYKDFHIDTRLESLFHGAVPRFATENDTGDKTLVESLPEWLIGVIVVVILLVIVFFIMIISTIIKYKRKNQSGSSSESNTSIHVCDDLELGKITMIDLGAKSMSLKSEKKNKDKSDVILKSQHMLSETACSAATNGSPMCTYKNPLFVDDDFHQETDQDGNCAYNKDADCYKAEIDSKDMETRQKHNISKTTVQHGLQSVTKIQIENNDHLGGKKVCEMNAETDDTNIPNINQVYKDISPLPNLDCDNPKVLVDTSVAVIHSFQRASFPEDNSNLDELELSCSEEITNNGNTVGSVDEASNEKQMSNCSIENGEPDDNCIQDEALESRRVKSPTLDTENREQRKSQRFSFIRMTLHGDSSDLENSQRSSTNL